MCGEVVWWWNERTKSERKCVVYMTILFVIVITLITLNLINKSDAQCENTSCIRSAISLLDSIDFSQNPCDDFYKFACGKFESQISGFSSVSAREKAKVTGQLLRIFLEPIHTDDAKSIRLQKQYHQSCENLSAIDLDEDRTFRDLIRRLGGWPVVSGNDWDESAFDLVEFVITLRKNGVYSHWFFDITVHPADYEAGLNNTLEINIPDNVETIRAEFLQDYVSLMVKVAIELGADERLAKIDMKNVMYFENRLADVIELARNESLKSGAGSFNMSLAEVQRFWQRINWVEFLNQMTNSKLNESDHVRFLLKPYLPWLDRLLHQTTKRTQVNYVMWKLVQTYAPFLSKKIRDAFETFRKLDPNSYDLWYTDRPSYCLARSRFLFQHALEAEYLRRNVNMQKRRAIQEMISRIAKQLEKKLKKASWMDSADKKDALTKLRNITFIIGGPPGMLNASDFDNKVVGVEKIDFKSDNIIDLTTEVLLKRDDFIFAQRTNNRAAKTFLYDTVTTTEAFFMKELNLLYLPAGLLEDSLFDDSRPNYLNYGRIGAVIGHELSHGFNLAASGNWSEETVDNFRKAAKCFDDNGNSTNSSNKTAVLETMADYSGINLSFEAYEDWVLENGAESGLLGVLLKNPQLFWVSYASRSCHVLNATVTEPIHELIPSVNRLTNSLKNSPHFSVDFNCPVGSDMNPATKCQF